MKTINTYINEAFRLRDDTKIEKGGYINYYCKYLTNIKDEEYADDNILNLWVEFIDEALHENMDHLLDDIDDGEYYIDKCLDKIEQNDMYKILNKSYGKTFWDFNIQGGENSHVEMKDCIRLYNELDKNKSNVKHHKVRFEQVCLNLHVFDTEHFVIVYLTGDEQSRQDAFFYTLIVATKKNQ